jgi:hypothetical protein
MPSRVDIFLAIPVHSASPPQLDVDPQRMRFAYRLELSAGRPDTELLEEAFRILNIAHPPDYNERSLSVGDVVTIDGKRSYICDWTGWKPLEKTFRRPFQWTQLGARLRVTFARWRCRLFGCNADPQLACSYCSAYAYDEDFIARGLLGLLTEIPQLLSTCKRRVYHRCAVCQKAIWFDPNNACSSESCSRDWLPF